jgi:hypothetical protein
MPNANVYTISNTNGSFSFPIQMGRASGPLESTQNADLTFYGYGHTNWGQEVDQNFYRLLENFACIQQILTPSQTKIIPASKLTLGNNSGINKPITGQSWYNLTDSELYICSNPDTNIWNHIISESYADTKYVRVSIANGTGSDGFIRLDGANTPMRGFLTLSGNPVNINHAATKGYIDTAITTLTDDVTGNYVHKAGDIMTGGLIIKGSTIAGAATNANGYLQNFEPHFVFRVGTGEGGGTVNPRNIVMGMGATDGSVSNPHIDFHSSGGNTDADSSISASGGNASVANQGTLTLTGIIVDDGRQPTVDNQLVHKAWVDNRVDTAIVNSTSTAASLYVKKAGDTMTGPLNMNAQRVTGLPLTSTPSDAISLSQVINNFYTPSAFAGSTTTAHTITISAAPPSGGVDGDIWFQL